MSGFRTLFQTNPQMKPRHQSSGATKKHKQAIIIRGVILRLRVTHLMFYLDS
jgi:hypothetical protein